MLTLKNLSLTANDAQGRTDIVKNVSLDVEDGKFYTAAANWAVANKIITGVDVDGTRYIQADTILSRAMAAQVIANSCYNDLL